MVPRQLQFNEHVNDHQVDFTKAVAEHMGNIIPVYDVAELRDTISDYDKIIATMHNAGLKGNNGRFNAGLEVLVEETLTERERR